MNRGKSFEEMWIKSRKEMQRERRVRLFVTLTLQVGKGGHDGNLILTFRPWHPLLE
jgi:hypothetical protein